MIFDYLIAFGIPTVFAVVGWLIIRDIDQWLSHWRSETPDLFDWQKDGDTHV